MLRSQTAACRPSRQYSSLTCLLSPSVTPIRGYVKNGRLISRPGRRISVIGVERLRFGGDRSAERTPEAVGHGLEYPQALVKYEEVAAGHQMEVE